MTLERSDLPDPAGALAAAAASRRRLAEARPPLPLWRHVALGGLTGALAWVQAWPAPLNVVGDTAVALAAAGVLAQERRGGLRLEAWRRGRTLPVILAVVAAAVTAGLAGLWLSHGRGIAWAPAAAGAGAAALGFAASRAWERAWRRDLEDPA